MSVTFILICVVLAAVGLLVLGAAPTPTARVLPDSATVRKLRDGYRALITLASDTNIEFWEKTVQPPGLDGGSAIDQTTMHNALWRTSAPRSLITLSEFSVKVAYDPVVYNSILSALNRDDDTVTITFRDGSTLCFFGFLQKFVPDALEEGKQPEATCTFVPTNWDETNGVEAGPVLTNVTGT